MIKRYLWRNLLSASLLLTLATIGITINPTATHLYSIATLIPYIQSLFVVSLALVGISLLGLSKSCKDWKTFKISLGRSIYLPALAGVVISLFSYGPTVQMIYSIQFLASILIFIVGFLLSWKS